MTDFSKLIEDAQKMPGVPEELEGALPDIFKNNLDTVTLASRNYEAGIPGAVTYPNLEYHCARLMMGKRIIGYDPVTRQEETEDVDDSARLEEIMDMSLRGDAIISSKKESFLKDGTVVIWVEWMEYKTPPPKKERAYMTHSELMSPEPASERTEAASEEEFFSSSRDASADSSKDNASD